MGPKRTNTPKSSLFARTQVTTGDARGTGLGLPSCLIFSEAAGGYCKLVATSPQDSAGNGGFSEFEFAICGSIVDSTPLVIDIESTGVSTVETKPPSLTLEPSMPSDITVVIVDDSPLIRKVLKKTIQRVNETAAGWAFEEFKTAEASQSRLLELSRDPKTIVICDENMESEGGVLKGADLIKWLVAEKFQGTIVSASGDADVGHVHAECGAHYVWGKPLKKAVIIADLDRIFSSF